MNRGFLVGFVGVGLFGRFGIIWGFVDEGWVLVETVPRGVDLGRRGVARQLGWDGVR
jgi:hypothetical protein